MIDRIDLLKRLQDEGAFRGEYFNTSFVKKAKNSKELMKYLYECIGSTVSEKIYLLKQDIHKIPTCRYCGKSVQFISYTEGYREYCSKSCRARSPESNQKRKQTNLERFGVESPAQSQEVQQKMRETTKKRHGVTNIFKDVKRMEAARLEKLGVAYPLQSPSILAKTQETNIRKYKVTNPNQNQDILNKRASTNLIKYGNICSLQNEDTQKKLQEKWKDRYGGHPSTDKDVKEKIRTSRFKNTYQRLFATNRLQSRVTPLFQRDDFTGIDNPHLYKCNICNSQFTDILRNGHIPRCPSCFPSNRKQGDYEIEVVEWLKNILPQETIIIQNDRKIISPLELDIYLPDYKLAIEFDEIYWHCESASNMKRDQHYHIGKTESCLSQNIRLIHIFENEWIDSADIVKSIIKAKLNIYSKKIGARECSIQKISKETSSLFLIENHLQGEVFAQIYLGLFKDAELLAVLLIGKNRYKENCYEVIRFANKKDLLIIGGFSKLWKHALTLIPEDTNIISYADLKYFTGESNRTLGFVFSHKAPPSYFYTKDYKVLENRLKYQKHKLFNMSSFIVDSKLTEWENMQLNGYDRIWDCGTNVWEYKRT